MDVLKESRSPRIWAILVLILLVEAATYSYAAGRIAVGYYMSWSRSTYSHAAIEYENLTHIAHAFIWPNSDGSLNVPSYFPYPELIQAAHSRGVKVVVSVGGWGQSAGFPGMAADLNARKRFVNELKSFCLTNGYDGADIDWEYPGSSDRANVTVLMRQLREAFASTNPPLTLSIAAPSSDWNGGYDFGVLKGILDWIGIMTYDFHGPWTSHAGHNSPLYAPSNEPEGSVDQSVRYYLSKGISSQKLCVGLAFHGYNFKASQLYGPSTGASLISYVNAIAELSAGWTYHWDSISYVPYLTDPSNTKLIAFDDTLSIRYKCEYLMSKSLDGVIIWALGYDNQGNTQPLLETVGRALGIVTHVEERSRNSPFWQYELLPNYPNPFNSQTIITYVISSEQSSAFVRLTVFDVLGREVATLVNGWQHCGTHTVSFDPVLHGRSISSGAYFYRLSVGGVSTVRAMTYTK